MIDSVKLCFLVAVITSVLLRPYQLQIASNRSLKSLNSVELCST